MVTNPFSQHLGVSHTLNAFYNAAVGPMRVLASLNLPLAGRTLEIPSRPGPRCPCVHPGAGDCDSGGRERGSSLGSSPEPSVKLGGVWTHQEPQEANIISLTGMSLAPLRGSGQGLLHSPAGTKGLLCPTPAGVQASGLEEEEANRLGCHPTGAPLLPRSGRAASRPRGPLPTRVAGAGSLPQGHLASHVPAGDGFAHLTSSQVTLGGELSRLQRASL